MLERTSATLSHSVGTALRRALRGWVAFNISPSIAAHSSPNAALVPLADTAYLAPFRSQTTLVLLAEIQDAVTHRDDDYDPRGILQRATEAWRATGICDNLLIGQTCEVLLLRSMQCRQSEYLSELQIQPLTQNSDLQLVVESEKTSPTDSAYLDASSKGWSNPPPISDISTYCGEVLLHLSDVGIDVEHASDSTAIPGHCGFRLAPVEPVRAADNHLLACEIIRSTALKYGLMACFLPAISSRQPMLGWDMRLSLVKSGESLVTGSKQYGLSDKGLAVAAGLLKNLASCMAITNPTDISYHRLQSLMRPRHAPDAQTAVHPLIQVLASTSQLVDRTIQLSVSDLTSNAYLSIAALLMAGLNGIEDNLSLDDDGRVLEVGEREAKKSLRLPMTLERAIARLSSNYDFLIAHDVFSLDVLKVWRRQLLINRMEHTKDLSPAGEFLARYRG